MTPVHSSRADVGRGSLARDRPLISIVMPSFNQGRWIDEALTSLLSQGDPRLEVIVIDGGSTDETLEVLERWRNRLHACVSEPDRGQADALAKGFALAKGEILGWLNSDDMHLPWTLSAVRSAFEQDPHLECLHGDRIIIDENSVVTGCRMLPGHSGYVLNRWPWTHQETCFWRRGLMDRCGGIDTSLSFAMDYDLFVRFFQGGRCAHLPRMLGAFRWHSESKSFRQQTTVGHREIAMVRRRYGVEPRWYERPVGSGMSLAIRLMRLAPRSGRSDGIRLGALVGSPISELWTDAPNGEVQVSGQPGA